MGGRQLSGRYERAGSVALSFAKRSGAGSIPVVADLHADKANAISKAAQFPVLRATSSREREPPARADRTRVLCYGALSSDQASQVAATMTITMIMGCADSRRRWR